MLVKKNKGYLLFPLKNKLITAVKTTEPKIDHTTGKLDPPIFTTKKSGKDNFLAIHCPSRAPMNPTTTETKHPPWEYPTSDCPMDPQIPAITIRSNKSSNDILCLNCFLISEA